MFKTSFHFKKLFTNSKNVHFSAIKMVLFSKSVFEFQKIFLFQVFFLPFSEINSFFKKMLVCFKKHLEVTTISTRRWTWRKKWHELGSGCHSDQPEYYKHLADQRWPTRTPQFSALSHHCCGERFDGHINYFSRHFSQKNLFRCNARAYVLYYSYK